MTKILSGKTAVVIGGSGGIGAAAAQALAAEGATVVVTWRSGEAAANALLATLPGTGHLARRAVVEDSSSLNSLAADVERRLGRCDILVNTAGYTRPIPIGDLDALTDEPD